MASRLTFLELNDTCSVLGLTSSRSIFQTVADSVYEPEILNVVAASRLSAAPLLSARIVGSPSPNGRSHASSTRMVAASTRAFNTRLCNGRSIVPVTPPWTNPPQRQVLAKS